MANIYHVKNSGNDSLDGLTDATAWATLSKVNGHTFSAGESCLFNQGDTWYGTLTIAQSGSNTNNPITFGAYGTGAKPIITGFTTISGWTNVGLGVYSKAVSTAGAPLNMVTVDGVNTGRGRYPKAGHGNPVQDWLWNTTFSYQSITSSDMPSSIINWAANGTANIFFKGEGYRWDHGLITSHSGTTINYTREMGSDEAWNT